MFFDNQLLPKLSTCKITLINFNNNHDPTKMSINKNKTKFNNNNKCISQITYNFRKSLFKSYFH